MKKLFLAAFIALFSFNAKAQDFTNFIETDNVMGKLTAPVTFIDYISMTCGHCAKFHENIFSKLKKEYIDTGKVAFATREFPFDDLAIATAKIARCAPEDRFYNFITAFLRTQEKWTRAPNKLGAISQIAAIGGMSPEKVQECIADKEVQKIIDAHKQSGLTLGVNSTPTFFINGKKYAGAKNYEQVKALIDAQLAK